MNPLHPVLAGKLAAAHIHDLRAAADLDRTTRPATARAPRSRYGTDLRLPIAVGRRTPSRPCAQVCRCA